MATVRVGKMSSQGQSSLDWTRTHSGGIQHPYGLGILRSGIQHPPPPGLGLTPEVSNIRMDSESSGAESNIRPPGLGLTLEVSNIRLDSESSRAKSNIRRPALSPAPIGRS